MEERSGSFLPELPYTNRGVIRQKEELSALIDWCQITIKEVPLEAVIEDVLRIPMELMMVTGYEKGIAGHEVVAIFDNIKVLKPTGNAQYQGFQILMSGKGCRNYENFLQLNEETWFDFLNRVCQYHINFPRIDLAIDDRKPYLSIPDLIVRTKEGLLSSKLREIDFHDSGELKEEVFQSKGGSLYLGSSASNLRLVFYEKGYEQNKKYGTELDENWNRYELRFRQEMAVSVVQELLRYRDVAGLAAVLAKHPQVIVLADEIYEHINYIGAHQSIAQFPEMKERTVIVNGVSKAYAMTGWRIGFIAGPEWIVKACNKLQGQYTSGPCSVSQKAAEAAYTGTQEPVKEMQKAFERRRDLIVKLAKEVPGFEVNVPQGAFYLFPKCSYFFGKSNGERKIENSDDLAMYLLEDAHVACVGGTSFGAPECIRMSYATSDENIVEAIRRIKEALAKLK